MLVRHLPADSAVARSLHGEVADWTVTDHLLACVIDALHVANWQRVGDKNAPRPKPLPRPGQQQRDEHLRQRLLEHRRRHRKEG